MFWSHFKGPSPFLALSLLISVSRSLQGPICLVSDVPSVNGFGSTLFLSLEAGADAILVPILPSDKTSPVPVEIQVGIIGPALG